MKNKMLRIIAAAFLLFSCFSSVAAAEENALSDPDVLQMRNSAAAVRSSLTEDSMQNEDRVELINREDNEKADLFSEVKGSCGENVFWTLDDTGRLTIEGSGEMDDMTGADTGIFYIEKSTQKTVPWYDLREEINAVTIKNGVTSIGNSSFIGCVNLKEISVPDSIVRIGKEAFNKCSSLETIRIPNQVTEIGSGAFLNCTALSEITLPEGLTTIEGSLFSGCSSLQFVNIPEGATSIGDGAFNQCVSLNSISIPGTVTSIGNYAFMKCDMLTKVHIPESVVSIGSNAFAHCSSLAEVTIEDGLTEIKDRTWADCCCLKSFTIPSSVSKIATYAWLDSTSLESITVASDNHTFKSQDGVLLSYDGTELISCPSGKRGEYSIPEGVTTIRHSAFRNCFGLTQIHVPAGVTEIGDYSFRNCTSLTGMTLPDGITVIPSFAFENCYALQSLRLPDSVTEIDLMAFHECDSLKEVILPDSLSSMSIAAFGSCDNLERVTAPAGAENLRLYTAFSFCEKLLQVNVDVNNNSYSSIDGVVFSKDQKTLLFYPMGREGSYSIPNGVTMIGDSAFENCKGLTGIIIPDTVTAIEREAFYNSGLLSVAVPDTVTEIGESSFAYCTNLTEAVVSENLKSLAARMFEGCTSLKTVRISDRTSTIGDNVFYGCSSLSSFSIPASVTNIGNNSFADCTALTDIYIPENVTNSFYNCFSGCERLETITVSPEHNYYVSMDGLIYTKDFSQLWYCPRGRQGSCQIVEGVKTISGSCFRDCKQVTEILIPDGTETIGESAFESCSALNRVALPDSLKTIGNMAFKDCTGLTAITIPEGVTSMGNNVFRGCSSLISADIADSITSIPDGSFRDCVCLDDLRLSASANSIGEYAFSGCVSLRDVSIPASAETIGEYAFSNCASLTAVNIPDGVTGINLRAFQCCSSLTDVSFPQSVESIGNFSFYGCCSLMTVTIHNGGASIGRCAFKECSSLRDVFYGGTEAQWNENGDITAHRANLFSSKDFDEQMETVIRLENVPGGVAVTMSGAGDQIVYTLDGSVPGTSSIPYEGPFLMDEAGEYFINARAFDLGSGTYGTIQTEYLQLQQSEAPVVQESEGKVFLTGTGNIYYTLDVSEIPTADDHLYTGPLQFSDTTCIKARVIESGRASSEVVSYVWHKPSGTCYAFVDDSYQFENRRESFGYTEGRYRIPRERYEEAFGKSKGGFLYNEIGESWGGSCFGLSATSLMFSKNMLPLEEYSDNAERVYDIPAPASPDSALTKLIERYQIAQFSEEVMMERGDPSEGGTMVLSGQNGNGQEGAALLNAVRNACSGGDFVVLILFRQDLSGSHAVVPYRIDDSAIYVYDNMEPGKEKKITYSVNEKGVYRFSYDIYSYAISFNRLSTILKGMEGIEGLESDASLQAAQEENILVSANSDDITVLDEQGEEIKSYLRYRKVDDSEGEHFVFSIPVGNYTVYNNDSEMDAWTLSAATEQDYYTMTVSDPSAGVELSEKYGRLSLSIQEDYPVHVQCCTSHETGRENMIDLQSSYVSIFAFTDKAVLVDSKSDTMVSNGNVLAMMQKEDESEELYMASVSSGDDQKPPKAYTGSRGAVISTDITTLPEAAFSLTSYVTGASDGSVLYAAAYSAEGRQITINKKVIEAGRKKYVFNIGEEAKDVRLFLLEEGSMKPLSSPVRIQ